MPKIIDLTAIESFFLTISDSKAKQMVEKVGNRLPLLKRVDGIRYKDHVSGCAIGHFKILREMLQRSGDFSPFFILEDDAWIDESAIESKNLQITVPSDTDGIYLGVSACANNTAELSARLREAQNTVDATRAAENTALADVLSVCPTFSPGSVP